MDLLIGAWFNLVFGLVGLGYFVCVNEVYLVNVALKGLRQVLFGVAVCYDVGVACRVLIVLVTHCFFWYLVFVLWVIIGA